MKLKELIAKLIDLEIEHGEEEVVVRDGAGHLRWSKDVSLYTHLKGIGEVVVAIEAGEKEN